MNSQAWVSGSWAADSWAVDSWDPVSNTEFAVGEIPKAQMVRLFFRAMVR